MTCITLGKNKYIKKKLIIRREKPNTIETDHIVNPKTCYSYDLPKESSQVYMSACLTSARVQYTWVPSCSVILAPGGAQDRWVNVGAVQPAVGDETVRRLGHVDSVPAHVRRHVLAHGVVLVGAPPRLVEVVDAAAVAAACPQSAGGKPCKRKTKNENINSSTQRTNQWDESQFDILTSTTANKTRIIFFIWWTERHAINEDVQPSACASLFLMHRSRGHGAPLNLPWFPPPLESPKNQSKIAASSPCPCLCQQCLRKRHANPNSVPHARGWRETAASGLWTFMYSMTNN